MKTTAVFLSLVPALASAQFALHNGDRVVFYGDSITDQRLYTFYTELYVRTRFPKMKVSFVHSGWGGDRVTGGGGGDIDTRLTRDVFAYHPTMVTIMLGMNDAGYRPFDQGLFDTYSRGFQHIVDRLKKEDPGVRITFIEPSPFDDVTRKPNFEGGYNGVLLKYSDYLKQLAAQNGGTVADFNGPEVDMLQKANATNPTLAQKLIPDRVHPGDAGHLTMAESLLKAWNAPRVVSSVEIDGAKLGPVQNAKVTDLTPATGGLSWTELDGALPFPLDLSNQAIKLVADSSDLVAALDQQTLKVTGLSGKYSLAIDGKTVATLSADDLSAGINLATLDTPMKAQAFRVMALVRERGEAHNQRWRTYQTGWPFGPEKAAESEKNDVMKALDRYAAALDREVIKAATPTPHQYTLKQLTG
jgi:lysophospholipase L1-like esterase